MDAKKNIIKPLVYTIEDRCKACFTCIRECPAKAISVQSGQANVIPERCIACGNCIKVCTRNAKSYLKTEVEVLNLLKENKKIIACIAPSFPAEFKEIEDYRVLVGMLKKIGFDKVVEVSFGADLVAQKYKDIILDNNSKYKGKKFISSDCPAIVSYITKYHPELTENLAPIVSPVMAVNSVVKEMYGKDYRTVFIGPCIAKKYESDEPDFVITFSELRAIFEALNVSPKDAKPMELDPPVGGKGAIFPVSRGLIQTIDVEEDIVEGNIVVAEGRESFKEAINEFENGLINDHHLELLCCEGCIMGPGMDPGGKLYQNRAYVTKYVKEKLKNINLNEWKNLLNKFLDSVPLDREFSPNDNRVKMPQAKEIEEVYMLMGKTDIKDRLDCHACGYESCEEHAVAVIRGLAEVEMCLPYMLEKLNNIVNELGEKNKKLVSIQQALKQSEKLAHLGQLSAGIAHELNNPLGVVIMYSNILLDEMDKSSEYYEDLKLITEQALRCKGIVGGLLNFARKSKIKQDSVNIREHINSCIKAVIIPDNIEVKIKDFLKIHSISLDEEQMTQVFTNIIKNGVEAMPDGGVLTITLENEDNFLNITISDTGTGIKDEHKDKLFTPFFTTKETGKGTGLGLPTSYGIVKMHKGKIVVETNADPKKGPTGTSFIIKLPQLTIKDNQNNEN